MTKKLIKKKNNIISSVLDGEVCLFNPDNAEYINLNKTGSFIWNLLDRDITLKQILEETMAKYKVEKEICEKEIVIFIDNLSKNQLIN